MLSYENDAVKCLLDVWSSEFLTHTFNPTHNRYRYDTTTRISMFNGRFHGFFFGLEL